MRENSIKTYSYLSFSRRFAFLDEELSITMQGVSYNLETLECLRWVAFQSNRLWDRETAREKYEYLT
jgi:hypothetical protein